MVRGTALAVNGVQTGAQHLPVVELEARGQLGPVVQVGADTARRQVSDQVLDGSGDPLRSVAAADRHDHHLDPVWCPEDVIMDAIGCRCWGRSVLWDREPCGVRLPVPVR